MKLANYSDFIVKITQTLRRKLIRYEMKVWSQAFKRGLNESSVLGLKRIRDLQRVSALRIFS